MSNVKKDIVNLENILRLTETERLKRDVYRLVFISNNFFRDNIYLILIKKPSTYSANGF